MIKQVYHYEVELNNDINQRLNVLCSRQENYMLLHNDNYTYIGLNAKEYIFTQDDYLNIVNKSQYLNKKGDYLKYISDWLTKDEIKINNNLPPFYGGAMGFISDTLYNYYKNDKLEVNVPHVCFMVYDEIIVIDYNRNKMLFIFVGEENNNEKYYYRFTELSKMINEIQCNELEIDNNFEVIYNKEIIISNFIRVRKYIEEKYYYYKNYNKLDVKTNLSLFDIYLKLNKMNNHCAIFKTSDFTLISGSNNNYIEYINDKLKIRNENNDHIIADVLINQLCSLNIDSVSYNKGNNFFNIECNIKEENTYDILHNFKILNHDYGLPFERILSYYRNIYNINLNGLIGFINYNGDICFNNIINPFIFDKKDSYVILECITTNKNTDSENIQFIMDNINNFILSFNCKG